MARVFGIHRVQLKPGVTRAMLDAFVREQVYPNATREDITFHIVRGERGERPGEYLMIVQTPSVDARNRYWPSADQDSDASAELTRGWGERWYQLVEDVEPFTDYVEIGR